VKVNEREESVETKEWEGVSATSETAQVKRPKKQRKSAFTKRTFQVFMPLKY